MEIGGSTVLVTGAGGTIGSAVVRSFLERGARVVASDLDAGSLDRRIGAFEGDPMIDKVVGDVADESHYRQVLKVAEAYGGLDIVVLNAGVYVPGLTWEIPLDEWRRQMEINFWGVLHGVRAVVPGMIERRRGHVVAVSSGAGVVATPGLAPYVASKHAVVGLMETLRHELSRVAPAVGASVVCPGNVASDMASNSLAALATYETEVDDSGTDERVADMAERILAGNAAGTGPDVVADAIVSAVTENRFWVVPHPEIGWVACDRSERMRDGREPVDWLA